MLSSVTSWWGGEKTETSKTEESSPKSEAASDTGTDKSVSVGDSQTSSPEQGESVERETITDDLGEVSAKAVNAAKEWGSYLYSFGKMATETAVKTAKQLKDTVEEKTIIGQFKREQDKFVAEKESLKKAEEAAVPPWVGYNEEEAMKSQILALSSDKRNFMRNPPAGVQFSFDFKTSSPVAMAMLQEDPNLEKMRFDLVPKQVSEEMFWRNYFYRVSLIKQSAQLTTLAQQTGTTGDSLSNKSSRTSSIESLHKEKAEAAAAAAAAVSSKEADDIPTGASPPDHEFASDAFSGEGDFNEEDLKKEMEMLGMTDEQKARLEAGADGSTGDDRSSFDDIPEWERELQAELQEYEVVDDGTVVDDTDLEKELLQQIEAEAQESS